MNKHFNTHRYHGEKVTTDFFEGWYFKHVSQEHGFNFALIPGISKSKEDPHAFIQLFITPMMIIKYFRFDSSDFHITNDPFTVTIKNNSFYFKEINVNLKDGDFTFATNLKYHNLTPIQQSTFSPNIMGPFSYLPKMECNHGVISMHHFIKGNVTFLNNSYHLDQDIGYIEKDWGTSFPKKYVWLQCNHFADPELSLMGSIAVIPYLGFSFEGLIFNIIYKDKEYRFATYNGSKFTLEVIDETTRKITLLKGKLRCEVIAKIISEGALKSPRHGTMSEMIKEGLEGTVSLKLFDHNICLVDSFGKDAGVEFTGY
jgi:tocopherol cyclase